MLIDFAYFYVAFNTQHIKDIMILMILKMMSLKIFVFLSVFAFLGNILRIFKEFKSSLDNFFIVGPFILDNNLYLFSSTRKLW